MTPYSISRRLSCTSSVNTGVRSCCLFNSLTSHKSGLSTLLFSFLFFTLSFSHCLHKNSFSHIPSVSASFPSVVFSHHTSMLFCGVKHRCKLLCKLDSTLFGFGDLKYIPTTAQSVSWGHCTCLTNTHPHNTLFTSLNSLTPLCPSAYGMCA